jgi:hypothetical protein
MREILNDEDAQARLDDFSAQAWRDALNPLQPIPQLPSAQAMTLPKSSPALSSSASSASAS